MRILVSAAGFGVVTLAGASAPRSAAAQAPEPGTYRVWLCAAECAPSDSARAGIAPDHAPRVLTVRATPARLAQVRALLSAHDSAGSPGCVAGPTGAPARGGPPGTAP